jgi:hypothetical protein
MQLRAAAGAAPPVVSTLNPSSAEPSDQPTLDLLASAASPG